VKEPNKFHI